MMATSSMACVAIVFNIVNCYILQQSRYGENMKIEKIWELEMWANAQRDDRPAEYR